MVAANKSSPQRKIPDAFSCVATPWRRSACSGFSKMADALKEYSVHSLGSDARYVIENGLGPVLGVAKGPVKAEGDLGLSGPVVAVYESYWPAKSQVILSTRYNKRVHRVGTRGVGEELLGATTFLTAIICFRDKGLILQVDNAKRYPDIVLLSTLFSSTKRHCLKETYICAVTSGLRKNTPSIVSALEKCEEGYASGSLATDTMEKTKRLIDRPESDEAKLSHATRAISTPIGKETPRPDRSGIT
ncbi:hypothetical protein WH47_01047 [Habropoda laboriosa]|uniref:Uncharacterized protein n=1 Tax=Habropoda laboriosa TaxID=597456 RepID=A0A0L7R0U1_9HYME|nr:hypothetical protein WH47_01047 [Habropoda laboriosa]